MDVNCSGYELVPQTLHFFDSNVFGACSNRGTCYDEIYCQCEQGWTGRSDFVNTEGLDCQINQLAIKLMWSFNLLFVILCSFLVRKEARAKWEQHKNLNAKRAANGGSFQLRENRGMLALLSFLVGTLPISIAFAIIKITRPEERVGLNWVITILFGLNKFAFYLCAYFFQPALLSTILRGQKNVKQLVIFSDTIAFWNMVVSSVAGFLPIITVISSDGTDRTARIVYVLYFSSSMLSMFSFGAQALYIKIKVVSALKKSFEMTKSKNILEIRSRLVQFQDGILKQTVIQFLVYAAFLLLPFLWNKHDYFLPISWLAMPLLYMKLAKSTVSTKKIGATSTKGSTNSLSKSKSKSKTEDPYSFQPGSSFNQSDLRTQAMSSFQSAHLQSFHEKLASSFVDPASLDPDDDSDDEYV